MKTQFRFGWLVAVLTLAAVACTCGAIGQATEAMQTAQALGTAAQQAATQAQALATQAEQSGFKETAEALATQSGDNPPIKRTESGDGEGGGEAPDDIPVYPDNTGFFGDEAGVWYSTSADFKTVTAFYTDEMPKNGWAEAEDPVEFGEMATLVYEKDSRKATVAIVSADGQTSVIIGIEEK